MIRKDIAMAAYLATLVRESDDFELVTAESLGIVCFRFIGSQGSHGAALDDVNAALLAAVERDGRVFITGTKLGGREVIRACIVNHRISREDIDYLLATIREVAAGLSL
jgi:glutamate/tyrosine decarboxylase-like PLP-dependent enzyme